MNRILRNVRGNSAEGVRLYGERRDQSDFRTHTRFMPLIIVSGDPYCSPFCGKTTRAVDVQGLILRSLEENPRISFRRIQTAENMSRTKMWRVLHVQLLYL
jgi:hypothetical protein